MNMSRRGWSPLKIGPPGPSVAEYMVPPDRADIFLWTTFENLVAKRRKINDRVVPILVAILIGMTSYALSRSEKVAEFARCVAP